MLCGQEIHIHGNGKVRSSISACEWHPGSKTEISCVKSAASFPVRPKLNSTDYLPVCSGWNQERKKKFLGLPSTTSLNIQFI